MAANEKKEHGRSFRILIISLLVILIAALGITGVLLYRSMHPKSSPNVLTSINEDATSILKEQLEKQTHDSVIIDIPSILVFPDGASAGMVEIKNVPENEYPISVDIILKDSGTTVLETGIIPVGSMLEKATLSEDLPKGEYPATAMYKTYNEDGTERGRVGIAITVSIKA